MGLNGDEASIELYKAMHVSCTICHGRCLHTHVLLQREVKQLAGQAGLDWQRDFKDQPAAELGWVYNIVSDQ